MTAKIITVKFRADTLFAVERDDGIYVAPKPICETLGIEWRKQRERINRDQILSEGSTIMVLPSPGGPQETTMLRIDLVNGWLFGISENAVKPESREAVLLYKRECYRALFERFYGKEERKPAQTAPVLADLRSEEPVTIRRSLVTECRQTFGHQSARELWFKLGMPIVPSMMQDPRQTQLFSYTAVKKDDEDRGAA